MRNTWTKIIGGVGAAGVLALSGAALSNAEGSSSSTASASSSQTNTQQTQGHHGHRMHGTPVTGATLTSVKNAIKAKDSAITVERVFVGPNGTYHAMGKKAGKRVHVEVSKDLKTVTVGTGHGGHAGEHRGKGMHRGTPVTGTALAKVKSVVAAQQPGVDVQRVMQGPKGDYHVLGTKAGKRVHLEVSKDLKTVTVKTGKPGGHGRSGAQGQAPSGQTSPSSSAGTSGAAA